MIVYRVPDGEPGAGGHVIHRVVGGNGVDGYVTQGDNKDSPDPWHPTNGDLVGRVEFMVPQGGTALRIVFNPVTLAFLGSVLFVWVLWPRAAEEETTTTRPVEDQDAEDRSGSGRRAPSRPRGRRRHGGGRDIGSRSTAGPGPAVPTCPGTRAGPRRRPAMTSRPRVGTAGRSPLGRLRRRVLIALAVFGLFGGVVASAATLGGLTSRREGAGDTLVAACDTDGVSVAYTTAYSATTGKYQVTVATVSGISGACNGQSLAITLRGTGGASLGAGSATVVSTSQAVPITGGAAADTVSGVAIVITG